MADYHCSVKVISRSKGRSATGAAAYRAGERIEDRRTGLAHDYTRKNGVDHCEILAPDGAPAWVYDRAELWNRVEEGERRKDSQVAREVEIGLPRELDAEQQRELATDYAREQFVSRGMIADVCLHHTDGHNPHAHIMLTMRELDGDGFASRKQRDWNDTELLEEWRAEWSRTANAALERAGSNERIDHRSLEDQGIERAPTIKMGPAAWALEARGVETERGDLNRDITAANDEYDALLVELDHYRQERRREAAAARDNAAERRALEQKDTDELAQMLNDAQRRRPAEIDRHLKQIAGVQEATERVAQLQDELHASWDQQQEARQQFDEQSKAAKEWEDHHPIRAALHDKGWKHDEQAQREQAIEQAQQQLQDALSDQERIDRELSQARQELNTMRDEAKPEAERLYREDPAREQERTVREVYMERQRQERQERLKADAERKREAEAQQAQEQRESDHQRRVEDDARERRQPTPEKLAEHVRKYGHPDYHEAAQNTDMPEESRKLYTDMNQEWKRGGPKAAREQTNQLRERFEQNPEEAQRFTQDAYNVQDTGRQERERQAEQNQERQQQAQEQQAQEQQERQQQPSRMR